MLFIASWAVFYRLFLLLLWFLLFPGAEGIEREFESLLSVHHFAMCRVCLAVPRFDRLLKPFLKGLNLQKVSMDRGVELRE